MNNQEEEILKIVDDIYGDYTVENPIFSCHLMKNKEYELIIDFSDYSMELSKNKVSNNIKIKSEAIDDIKTNIDIIKAKSSFYIIFPVKLFVLLYKLKGYNLRNIIKNKEKHKIKIIRKTTKKYELMSSKQQLISIDGDLDE